jgi:hypothetical protein
MKFCSLQGAVAEIYSLSKGGRNQRTLKILFIPGEDCAHEYSRKSNKIHAMKRRITLLAVGANDPLERRINLPLV